MPHNILDAISIVVWQTNLIGEFVYRNSRFKAFFGTELPVEWEKAVHPEDITAFIPHLRAQTGVIYAPNEGIPAVVEIDVRIKGVSPPNTKYNWHRISRCPLFDPSNDLQLGWVITSVNINNEREKLNEGYDRESIFREVVNFCEGPIVTSDNDGLIVSFNRSAEKLFQYTEVEVLGHPINILMPPEISKYHDKYLTNYTSTGHLTIQAMGRSRTLTGVRKDGTRVPITLMLSDFVKDNKHFYIACIQEIHTADNVERKIRESKSMFISTISHELRTPLFGILGIASLLASKGQYSREQLEYFKCLEASSKSMMLLINNIVDYYCIQNGLIKENAVLSNVKMLVDDLYDTFAMQVSDRVKIVITLDESLPPELIMDSSLIRQIAYNLISNACKFTESGTITIKLGLGEEPSDTSQLLLHFVVSDTGVGISPAFSNHMFEMFTQENSGDSRIFGGLGLGLAVCKEFVSILHGNTTFKSILGVGSEFIVTVPVAIPLIRSCLRIHNTTPIQSPVSEKLAIHHTTVNNLASQIAASKYTHNITKNNADNNDNTMDDNIAVQPLTLSVGSLSSSITDLSSSYSSTKARYMLVVDDNILNQKVLTKMLNSLGWKVTLAANGREALQLLFGKNCLTKLPRSASVEISGSVMDASISQLPLTRSCSSVASYHTKEQLSSIPLLGNEDSLLTLDYWLFDMIVMDIQMPMMDGYECTRHIRAWETAASLEYPAIVSSSSHSSSSPALHIPIIALTAMASYSEQSSIEAGMDVFIRKPVSKTLLIKYIELLEL